MPLTSLLYRMSGQVIPAVAALCRAVTSGIAAHLRQHGCGLSKAGVDERRMHMKHRVVEVGVSVGARPRPQQAFPLGAAQEGHMLHQVGYALLVLLLIYTACRVMPLTINNSIPCV